MDGRRRRGATFWIVSSLLSCRQAQESPQPPPESTEHRSWLGHQYELDRAEKEGTFNLDPHAPTYLALHYSTDPNEDFDPDMDVQAAELQFQISAKTKVWEDLLYDRMDLWLAYTQQAQWQVFQASGPLREIDYEPEAILTTRIDLPAGPLQWRMLNLGLDHQSNGEEGDLSRSWNRLYFQFGLERGDFVLLIRPWIVIGDKENPDIEHFMGRGDLVASWERNGWNASVLLRNNLERDENRGAFQVLVAAPTWTEKVRVFARYFTGYGDSLNDYNHREQTFALGLMFTDWN